jgi:hypothetical protein
MFAIVAIPLGSASAAEPASAHAAQVADFSWLAGCWDLADGVSGSEEHWLAPAGGLVLGLSRRVEDGRAVAWEVLQIRETAPGQVALVAKPHDQPEATFPLAAHDATSATFENPQHDFPQRILYRRDGDSLVARIEGEQGGETMGFDFPMRRRDCEAPRGR